MLKYVYGNSERIFVIQKSGAILLVNIAIYRFFKKAVHSFYEYL